MKSSVLAALAATSLVVAGTASAAETRSAAAMPTKTVSSAKLAGTGVVNTSRRVSAASDESKIVGLALLPTLLLGSGLIASIILIAKSKG